ncbi:hypothetical protein MRB53_039581 [Persea americana]|nr:hypothetical protein MRB53_039581 [Persea americana]
MHVRSIMFDLETKLLLHNLSTFKEYEQIIEAVSIMLNLQQRSPTTPVHVFSQLIELSSHQDCFIICHTKASIELINYDKLLHAMHSRLLNNRNSNATPAVKRNKSIAMPNTAKMEGLKSRMCTECQ